jgi:hypothetical protein
MRVRSCTSKFDHNRQRRITVPFTIRILNPKYLNDDDNEGERERKEVNTHSHTGETPSAFFKQHQNTERERDGETFDENAHNLHKALSNREKKKVDISTKIFLSW